MVFLEPVSASSPAIASSLHRQASAGGKREKGNPVESKDHWLVFNAKAYDKADDDEDLRALLEYIATGKADSADSLQGKIAAEVEIINRVEEKVREMFTAEQTIQMERERRAFEKGEDKGKAEGFAEAEAKHERCEKLTDLLLDASRFDGLRRMRNDATFREQLYTEFGI